MCEHEYKPLTGNTVCEWEKCSRCGQVQQKAPDFGPQELAFLKLTLFADGAMSIEGNVADYRTCRNMLDAAHEAIKLRTKGATGAPLETQIITETDDSITKGAVRA